MSPNSSNSPISAEIQELLHKDPQHPLQGFAVIHEQTVEWGDMDAFQHVNNVKYYEYAQTARVHYLKQVDMFDEKTYTVLATSSCNYLQSVVFPDTLWIGLRAKKIGNTSLTHEYVYYSTQQQKVVATAESVLVFFDEGGKNKVSLTDAQRESINTLEVAKK